VDSQQRGSPSWELVGGETTHHNNLYGIKCLTNLGLGRIIWNGTHVLDWFGSG